MQAHINIENGKIAIYGPYSEINNKKWRELGGKFAGDHWVVPDNGFSRIAIADMFGPKSNEVDVLIPASRLTDGSIVQIGGYVLAQRRGRDYPVRMPDGVSLASGSFRSSGGSVKNPRVCMDSDIVFRLCCRESFAAANGLEIASDQHAAPAPIDI